MDDMISRAYVLAEYDRQHKGPPGGARKIMEEAPTIPAIPVEWLEDKELDYRTIGDKLFSDAFAVVISEWSKEQEAK